MAKAPKGGGAWDEGGNAVSPGFYYDNHKHNSRIIGRVPRRGREFLYSQLGTYDWPPRSTPMLLMCSVLFRKLDLWGAEVRTVNLLERNSPDIPVLARKRTVSAVSTCMYLLRDLHYAQKEHLRLRDKKMRYAMVRKMEMLKDLNLNLGDYFKHIGNTGEQNMAYCIFYGWGKAQERVSDGDLNDYSDSRIPNDAQIPRAQRKIEGSCTNHVDREGKKFNGCNAGAHLDPPGKSETSSDSGSE